MLTYLLIGIIILLIIYLYWVCIDKKYYKEKSSIQEELIENLNQQIDNQKEWHDITRLSGARASLSEACLLKALEEHTNNINNKGVVYANRWLTKREELLKHLTNECDAVGNRDLFEIYESSSRIAYMILKGELDINKD